MNDTERARAVTPAEWGAALVRPPAKEKDLTRARHALAADRRRMPWLKAEQVYTFGGPNGPARLADLVNGRRQILGWTIPWYTITDGFDEYGRDHAHHD